VSQQNFDCRGYKTVLGLGKKIPGQPMPGKTEAALDPQWTWSFIVRRRDGMALAG
jgi:hypothetical protein